MPAHGRFKAAESEFVMSGERISAVVGRERFYARARPTPAIRIARKQTFNDEFQIASRHRCAIKLPR